MTRYEDIINLPRHVSERHARMSMLDRAAQFSPFAALTGYDAAIRETARLTCEKIELDESEIALLNISICKALEGNNPVRITYFLLDERKNGGAYVCTSGQVKKFDEISGSIIMGNGMNIPIDDIVEVTGIERAGDIYEGE